jgi:hypothetical protein
MGGQMPSESNDARTSRRAFLARFAGAAFAVPVIASFALDGVAQASERSYHHQGQPNQTSGNQGSPKQCHPNQTTGNQGHPKQGHPNQTSGNQGYPNHGHPKQCHPNQSNPNQTHSDSIIG